MSDENEEIDFEPEDELGSLGAAKAKMQKLREELKEAKTKRDEYLEGWQRAKAEMVNLRRETVEAMQKSGAYAREALIEDFIPALDSFDMAMQGGAWQSVDAAWRVGVEGIRNQLLQVLRDYGVETFGAMGDTFDPTLHEPVQEIPAEQTLGEGTYTIAKIVRTGYRIGERVVRPAHVVLYK